MTQVSQFGTTRVQLKGIPLSPQKTLGRPDNPLHARYCSVVDDDGGGGSWPLML